ncbi:exophilin-5 [Pseudophryne corroboree]|uniref:exophilin-5 n=1 Tax=Pseudophryne corroboree TaxID=495146 RepID=UPI0030821BA8
MTNPGTDRLDLSFLREEEASQILGVLERDEQLRRTDRERLCKLKSSKRDVKWLHALSGEWFEEIQKKKFKDDTDVRSLVRPPLTHLGKKTPKGESESSRMTTSRNFQSQKSSSSGPSFLRIRSPFSSLFSFRKSSKQNIKPPPQPERPSIFTIRTPAPPSTEVKKKFEIYQSTTSVKQIANFFEAQRNRTRTNETAPPASQLESEVFQVLGDLDQKLAQEQSYAQTARTSRISSYKHEGNEGSRLGTAECRKDYSTLSSYDGRRTVLHGEGHTTYATYQPRRFSEMYSNRNRSASKEYSSKKNVYRKTPSVCSALNSTSPSSAPISSTFSSSSLELPSMSLELERTRQHKSRRIPVISIKWNNGLSSGQPEEVNRPSRTQSSLDLTDLGNPTHHNRIYDLYKYKRIQAPTTHNLHREDIANDMTSTALHNNSDNRSTEYYKTDYRGLRPVMKFPMQNTRHCEEENKENAFKANEITSKLPSANSDITSDKEVEPMEFEIESPVQLDSNIITQNSAKTLKTRDLCSFHLQIEDISAKADVIKEDCVIANDNETHRGQKSVMHQKDNAEYYTITSESKINQAPEPLQTTHSDPSDPETMEVDVPSVSTNSTFNSLSAVSQGDLGDTFAPRTEQHTPQSGLLFTDRHLPPYASQNLQSSFKHSTFSDISLSNNSDWKNPMSPKTSTLFNNTSDTVGRLSMLNTRWSSKDKHTEDFVTDTMRHQRRNASSLPDLIDQKNYMFIDNDDTKLLKNSHEKATYCNSTTETKSTWLTDEAHKTPLYNNEKCGHFKVENPNSQAKESSLEHLQKPYTFCYVPVIGRTSEVTGKKTTLSQDVSHLTDTMTENNNIKKKPSNVTDVIPTLSDLHEKYKSMYFNGAPYRNYGMNGADRNNNRQSIEIIPTSEDVGQSDELKAKNGYIDGESDGNKTQHMKASESEMTSKQNPTCQQDGVSLTNQQNRNRIIKANPNSEPEISMNKNFDQHGYSKVLDSVEPLKIKDLSKYSTSQVVEDNLESTSSSRALIQPSTENKSANLLKQHLLLAPEPYKRNTKVKENIVSPWKCPASSEDGHTPSTYKCENSISNINADLSTEHKPTHESTWTHKTYTVTENTHIYEANYVDSSHPDVDKIEYHKIVSVYYSLPRKYSKRMSELTRNNLKNIDRTLESSNAPSSLLDKFVNKYQEAEETHDSTYQNIGKTSPSTTENTRTKELRSGDTSPCKPPLLNFQMIPLQSNLINKNNRSSGEETTSPSNDDFLDRFSSLRISENEGNTIAKEDLQMQRNLRNKNEYSPLGSSPKFNQNIYYTLPSRKSSLQDLERNILEKDITMAHDRRNIYSQRENTVPTTPGLQDVFSSPTFTYDNPNYSQDYFTHFQETNRPEKNINHYLVRDNTVCQKGSFDEGLFSREELPAAYTSKNLKDLSTRKSFNSSDISPHVEPSNLPTYNQPKFSPTDKVTNRTRPSYCSEFVQKKMKPINAKKFSFSFDHSGQQEYGKPRHTESFDDYVRKSDTESPPGFYTQNDNNPSHVNKHYYGQSSPTQCSSSSNLYRSKSLKILNTENRKDLMGTRRESNGSFSSKSYGENLRSRRTSTYHGSDDTTCNRRFSADTIIDENDNWPITDTSHYHKPVYTSKSLDYGIFGKEQQAALLNNVKRSLTEGRLWRPSFLKNPGFLRNEEPCSSQESPSISGSPGDVMSQGPNLKGFLNIYKDEPAMNSDSDTDTTTDDEYYLDENDKESEL